MSKEILIDAVGINREGGKILLDYFIRNVELESLDIVYLLDRRILNNHPGIEKNKVIEEQLWRTFVDHPVLTNSYDEVIVIHDNNLNTFVPNSLFDASYLASYLQYTTKVFETDFFAFDELSNYEMNNVYIPYVNMNNFFIDQYGSFDYKHTNSILVSKLLDLSKNNEESISCEFG